MKHWTRLLKRTTFCLDLTPKDFLLHKLKNEGDRWYQGIEYHRCRLQMSGQKFLSLINSCSKTFERVYQIGSYQQAFWQNKCDAKIIFCFTINANLNPNPKSAEIYLKVIHSWFDKDPSSMSYWKNIWNESASFYGFRACFGRVLIFKPQGIAFMLSLWKLRASYIDIDWLTDWLTGEESGNATASKKARDGIIIRIQAGLNFQRSPIRLETKTKFTPMIFLIL